MDTLSNITKFTYTLPELYTEITKHGWEIKNVKYDKAKGRFVASARSVHGEEMAAFGKSDHMAVGNLLLKVVHRNGIRTTKIAMWTHNFVNQLTDIAEAYSKAPIYEPKAATAFMALGRDSEHRAKVLSQHLDITVVDDPEPYTSPEKMFDDVRKRRKLEVSRAGVNHSMWSPEQVIAYRIVHDVLGHCASGGGFDWEGENRAFAAHVAILPHEAQQALFTESIASTAYATYYRAYGPLKIALFPEFIEPAQDEHNPSPNHRGIHPSESRPPIPQPSVKPLISHIGQDSYFELGMPKKSAMGLGDPNAGWSSGVEPLPFNALHDYGDPLGAMPPSGGEPAQEGPLFENARLVDTEWTKLNQENPAELARMKQAITNAFRVVLLSPRKDLRWNAVHYQDIASIPGEESDPTVYWHKLENARQEWNVARHGEDARYAHMPYYKQWKELEQLMYQKDPQGGIEEAKRRAEQFLFRTRTRIEEQVMAEDGDRPEDKQRNMYQIELEANKRLAKALKTYIEEHQLRMDFQAAVAPGQMGMDIDVPEAPTPDKSKYGAWMGTHLQAIAQISSHVDEILKAALDDVHEHRGEGHHFRATVLSLNIPGVGPKVCSFAWLLLQPMTSQLATMDTHMMDVLGHHYEKDMNPRDYFKYERELAAGRDASGYGHVPLGLFQWGMWDNKRTGPGTHQDHSAMRVLDPKNHQLVDWETKQQNLKGENWVPPEWWTATQEARDNAANDFDQTIASNVPATRIPFQQPAVTAKTAVSQRTPWFKHPETGEQVHGLPGQTLMQHLMGQGFSLASAWQLPDEAVGKI